jgi:adenylate cyclase
MVFREIDTVQVKGKEKGERIFELIGYADDTDIPKNTIDEFQTALELFRNQNWSKAGEIFNKLAEKGDVPSQVFAKRCNEYRKNPPPQDWNGIYVMQTK